MVITGHHTERGEGGAPPRAGFEATNAKTAIPCGITVLLVEEGGFEPPKRIATDLQSAPFGHSGNPPYNWSW